MMGHVIVKTDGRGGLYHVFRDDIGRGVLFNRAGMECCPEQMRNGRVSEQRHYDGGRDVR